LGDGALWWPVRDVVGSDIVTKVLPSFYLFIQKKNTLS